MKKENKLFVSYNRAKELFKDTDIIIGDVDDRGLIVGIQKKKKPDD